MSSKFAKLFENSRSRAGRMKQRVVARSRWKRLQQEDEILLEFGSGSKRGSNGWTTVDLTGADISWDLRSGIPLNSNSVDRIYSSHLLEHIPYPELIKFLGECLRVLKSDGNFSVCVPNFRHYIEAYIKKTEFIEKSQCWKPGVVDTGSSLDQVNYMAYMKDEHKYMFDEENLINTLRKAGFAHAELRTFDAGIDLKKRDFESIYATAYKKA